jgi:hypothetical protein
MQGIRLSAKFRFWLPRIGPQCILNSDQCQAKTSIEVKIKVLCRVADQPLVSCASYFSST